MQSRPIPDRPLHGQPGPIFLSPNQYALLQRAWQRPLQDLTHEERVGRSIVEQHGAVVQPRIEP